MGKERKQIQSMLAKRAAREHILMRCTFLDRLLGNTLPWKSPSSTGKGLVCWLLSVFCVSFLNTAPQGSGPQPFWVVLLSPSGCLLEVKLIAQ